MKRNITKLICGIFICCIGLCVCAELFSVKGAGTADDPLITLSYVQNKILHTLKDRITNGAKEILSGDTLENDLKKHGDSALASITAEKYADSVADSMVGSLGELRAPSATSLRRFTLASDKMIVASPGATLTVINGSVNAAPEVNGTVLLVGQKKELKGENTLGAGSYAVVSEIGNVLFTADSDAVVMVSGKYDIKSADAILVTPMYRLYNPNSGEHFYTGSIEERDNLVGYGWIYEGVAWNAPVNSGEPVYRCYNPNSGDHHYTMNPDERDMLVGVGWIYEGVCWNSASPDNLPLYRLWNPNADCGSHHYTGSTEERDGLLAIGWIDEGVGWYGTEK